MIGWWTWRTHESGAYGNLGRSWFEQAIPSKIFGTTHQDKSFRSFQDTAKPGDRIIFYEAQVMYAIVTFVKCCRRNTLVFERWTYDTEVHYTDIVQPPKGQFRVVTPVGQAVIPYCYNRVIEKNKPRRRLTESDLTQITCMGLPALFDFSLTARGANLNRISCDSDVKEVVK